MGAHDMPCGRGHDAAVGGLDNTSDQLERVPP
jgi:hypothetical protein